MDQQELVRQVLCELPTVPATPRDGRYLTLAEAEAIVAETIDHVRQTGDAREYVYLTGHRRRLAVSLTMIPKAENGDATCLDVGCFGYMAFWAWLYLGYARVVGVEMRPGEDPMLTRSIEMGSHRLELVIHNFDIADPNWPLQGTFDTVLFFETLRHVDRDPSGVILNVTRCMRRDSTLVVSVPNAVSYKTLQEFITGAPPWTYWFFHPDLNHEPRHYFEYTPIFFKIILRCAGLAESAFCTICAYVERESVDDMFEIGASLSVEPDMFGDTMIAQVRKVADEPLFRYPECIYDADRYYRSTFPVLHDRMKAAQRAFIDRRKQADDTIREARHAERTAIEAREQAETKARVAAARSREAMLLCDSYNTKFDQAAAAKQMAEQRAADAETAARAAEQRAADAEAATRAAEQHAADAEAATRAAEQHTADAEVATRTAEQRARVAAAASREAMFLCDSYLAKLQRTEAAAHEAEARYQAISRSTFWRVTGPFRRLASRFPATTARVRAVLAPPARLCRELVRGVRRP